MVSRYQNLLTWKKDTSDEITRLTVARQSVDTQIEHLKAVLAQIENLLELEINAPEPLLPVLSSSGSANEQQHDQNVTTESKKRKNVTRRWLGFARGYLEHTEATVEKLLNAAPPDIVSDLKDSGPPDSLAFRARRMLRRDDRFMVDRTTGVVKLAKNNITKKPQAPSVLPHADTHFVVIQKITKKAEGGYSFLVRLKDQADLEEWDYNAIYSRISTHNDVWVPKGEKFEGVAIYPVNGNARRMTSYNLQDGWTSTLTEMSEQGAAA